MRKILLFGANGQLGTALKVLRELRDDITLIPLSRQTCDVLNFDNVLKILEESDPDIVINVAAFTDVLKAESQSELVMKLNYNAAVNIAFHCHTKDIPLIHLSTDYVFDGEKKALYVETDVPHPLNVYGRSKLLAEKDILSLHQKSIIIRTSWFFSKYGNNFLKKILHLSHTQSSISVIDDVQGTPTSCEDLAEFIFHICTHLDLRGSYDQYGIYHFAGYPLTTWFTFANTILKTFQLTESVNLIKTSSASTTQNVSRPKFSGLDSTKAQDYWGILPSYWVSSLEKMKDYKAELI